MGECIVRKQIFWRFSRRTCCDAWVVPKEPNYVHPSANPTLGQCRKDAWARFVLASQDEAAE